MKRLTRDDITTELFVALKMVPKHIITKLRGLPVIADEAAREVADALADRVDSVSTCVVRADLVTKPGKYREPGYFGEDEPWPAELRGPGDV